MKKFKIGFLAVLLALGASAFTSHHKAAMDWYAPISNTLQKTDPAAQLFSSYVNTPENQPTCSHGNIVCAAEFPNTSQPPTNILVRN